MSSNNKNDNVISVHELGDWINQRQAIRIITRAHHLGLEPRPITLEEPVDQ